MGQLLKQALTEQELLQLLNWELAAYEQCENCHFSAVERTEGDWLARLDNERELSLAGYAIAWHLLEDTRRAYALR